MAATSTLSRLSGRPAGALGLIRDNPVLIPALAAVVVFVALGASEAGFYEIGTSLHPGLGWYPAGLLLLALLAVSLVAVPPPRPLPRWVVAALALLGAYTAWSFASIAWAEQQGVAWDGANRATIYLVVFALFALWPFTARGGMLVLGLLGLGVAGLGVVELLKADAAPDPITYFIDARFAEPAGYQNANAALWTLGLFACLYLACAREANAVLRGAALGGAGVLACLALMAQSRGWVLAVPPAALLFIVFMPGRLRALAAVSAVALGAAIASPAVIAVHDDFTPETLDSLLADATTATLTMGAALAIVGLVAALGDRRIRVTEAAARKVDRAALAGLGLVLVLGVVLAAAAAGDPVGKLSDSWESFKSGGEGSSAGGSRFATVGTNRYDFWSLAWERFEDEPVTGIGSANFQADYLAEGNSGEQPRYPHSLPLGVLSQTGLVGFLLLGGAIAAGGLAALRARRRVDAPAAAVVGGAAALFAYWLLHASVDWFWEFPALTATAFAALGLAAATGREHPVPAPEPPDAAGGRRLRLPRPVAVTSLALVGLLCALSLIAPWLAERDIEAAATGWSVSTTDAYERLDRAAKLNPLSPKPHLMAASIAVRVEDQARAARELEEVLRIEPRTPFALAELGALASERGQNDVAERLLVRARAQAPRDDVVKAALERVQSGETVTVRDLNDSYLRAARTRLGRE